MHIFKESYQEPERTYLKSHGGWPVISMGTDFVNQLLVGYRNPVLPFSLRNGLIPAPQNNGTCTGLVLGNGNGGRRDGRFQGTEIDVLNAYDMAVFNCKKDDRTSPGCPERCPGHRRKPN